LTKYSEINHGTMLHIAHEEGLLSNHSNMHLGSRCMLFDEHFDLDNDLRCGFSYIRARELDKLGVDRVVEKIKKTVGDELVYLSVDIDVLDPGMYECITSCLHADIAIQPLLRPPERLSLADGLRASFSKS